ncbi:metallophosphoesterase [Photobacterium kishitanii]|uniref:Serine/threonine-protein phosphatase n=1 Tax=Photobacterium kishitanii TaxID=318456 RepID=A0A2T3KLR9_9GAMM|nr:metallophosphoesterase [Photobacterium kishitanii]PSV00632.1 serine/threonine-protein phosphatase [Photobacterium kishitanii]
MFKELTYPILFNADDYENVYICTDPHGNLAKVLSALAERNFNKKNDLLICNGDLIDRGANSLGCLRLINEKWFKAVSGNHERMAYDYIFRDEDALVPWIEAFGSWYKELTQEQQLEAKELLGQMRKAPYILEVSRKGKTAVLCHADYPFDVYNAKKGCPSMNVLYSTTRSDDIVEGEPRPISGADLFIFGHTPFEKPLLVDNLLYLDTGAGYGGELAMINLDTVFTIAQTKPCKTEMQRGIL